ncbi:MAG: hypothetical protein EB037_11375, partial [Actinobacteria bacterium]|nr:hypothetical protein [Actinomycetota bacterium]
GGTSFHDSVVVASVNQLIKVLGEPDYDGNTGEDKTNFEWDMELDSGDVFTVYDWKEYRMIDIDEEIEWHIGGRSFVITDEAANQIQKAISKLSEASPENLAVEMVGDGKDPNKFFVTVSPCFMVESDEVGEVYSEYLDGYSEKDKQTFMFDTFEEANECYNLQDLNHYEGVCSVTMEDRKTGTIKDKYLLKVISIDYSEVEQDDSKTFGYIK